MKRSYDAIVIGSGAGGAPVALTLAEAGASVLLVERGPHYPRSAFTHDEIGIARRDFFVPSSATDPHVVVDGSGVAKRTNEGWVASCVGGGTVHMSGFFYRFLPIDFHSRDLLGDIPGASVANWPIQYQDLQPYYEKVESLVGVSGPAYESPAAAPRRGPYPYPPVATHPVGGWIDAAAKKLGLASFQTPRAIITQAVGNRGACVYCQLCGSFGCETGAKSSTLESVIPQALATGKCDLVADTRAIEIVMGPAGKARGVVLQNKEGAREEVSARVVVAACSTIESIRLFLLSTSQSFPNGLANDYGLVGKNLMFSTLSKAHGSFLLKGVDSTRDEALRAMAPFVGRSILDYYTPKKPAPVTKAGALNFLFPSGGPIYQAEQVATAHDKPRFGADLMRSLHHYFKEQRQVDCETFGEYLPNPGTFVDLDDSVKDAAGFPSARIHIDRHPHDAEVSRYLAKAAEDVLKAAGADTTWQSTIGGRTMHLPMGGMRMSTSADAGVVDPTCKTHAVDNVYVSDGSTFVSSGGVPPTFTILANALRVGDAIAERLRKGEL